MDLIPATQEEILIFKQAAANRYKELGIPPKVAEQCFNAYMNKVAEEMSHKDVTDRSDKLTAEDAAEQGTKKLPVARKSEVSSAAKADPEKEDKKASDKIQKIASAIAQSVGRARK